MRFLTWFYSKTLENWKHNPVPTCVQNILSTLTRRSENFCRQQFACNLYIRHFLFKSFTLVDLTRFFALFFLLLFTCFCELSAALTQFGGLATSLEPLDGASVHFTEASRNLFFSLTGVLYWDFQQSTEYSALQPLTASYLAKNYKNKTKFSNKLKSVNFIVNFIVLINYNCLLTAWEPPK